jgi:hypothetical protein
VCVCSVMLERLQPRLERLRQTFVKIAQLARIHPREDGEALLTAEHVALAHFLKLVLLCVHLVLPMEYHSPAAQHASIVCVAQVIPGQMVVHVFNARQVYSRRSMALLSAYCASKARMETAR